LRAFIGRRVRNPADVDDLVQRVLLQLVRGLGSLRDRDRLHAWLYRTARNVIVDHYRSSGVRRELASGASSDLAGASDDGVDLDGEDERTALRELADCTRPMLERLAPAYRQALMLTEIDGRSQTDVAREMGLSVSGMKSRVQRGRRQLRAALERCCRIELDRRGSVMTAEPRSQAGCGPCGRRR
jgi:RNA polymerase sigma-70 factor (ECF subfamily)